MSEMQLSPALIDAVHQAVIEHDADANDAGVFSQYLAAVIGFQLGVHDMPIDRKQEILQQLFEFSGHVMQDVESQRQPEPATPSPQDAYGIWKPGQD